jgi:hypothetical protein
LFTFSWFGEGWNIANNMIAGLIAGIINFAPNVISTFANEVANKLPIPFDMGSPSKLAMGWGKNIIEGLTVGIQNAADTALVAFGRHCWANGTTCCPEGTLTAGLGNITTTNISNSRSQSTRVFNPVYNTSPNRETVDATRNLYREWVFQG